MNGCRCWGLHQQWESCVWSAHANGDQIMCRRALRADCVLPEKNSTELTRKVCWPTVSLNFTSTLLPVLYAFHLGIFNFCLIKEMAQRGDTPQHIVLFIFKDSCARPCSNWQWHKSWLRINCLVSALSRNGVLRIIFISMETFSKHLFSIMSSTVRWQNR